MPLTKDFRETIRDRAQRDASFRRELAEAEGVNFSLLSTSPIAKVRLAVDTYALGCARS